MGVFDRQLGGLVPYTIRGGVPGQVRRRWEVGGGRGGGRRKGRWEAGDWHGDWPCGVPEAAHGGVHLVLVWVGPEIVGTGLDVAVPGAEPCRLVHMQQPLFEHHLLPCPAIPKNMFGIIWNHNVRVFTIQTI